MAKKRKHRRVNLGSSASEHRAEANRYLSEAQSLISSIERSSKSCPSMLMNLLQAERLITTVNVHRRAMGQPLKRGKFQVTKAGRATTNLDARLEELETEFKNDCMK